MKITDIKTQVKNINRVSVYLDGQYTLSLSIEQLAELKDVRVGGELDRGRVEDLKRISSESKLYANMLDLILRRPRSIKEIKLKLRLKKIDEEIAEAIIGRLINAGYLDDEKFSEWWIRTRKESKRGISKLNLKTELVQKGVATKIYSDKLEAMFSAQDEEGSLRELLVKKRSKYTSDEKLIAYLASKGFRYDQIKKVLNDDFN